MFMRRGMFTVFFIRSISGWIIWVASRVKARRYRNLETFIHPSWYRYLQYQLLGIL